MNRDDPSVAQQAGLAAGADSPRWQPRKPTLVERLRAAPVAALLVVVNVIVFVLAERAGSTTRPETLVQFGATWRPLVWQGEYWRLATSMFLHIGVVHLLWNGYGGFLISAQVEQAIGFRRFLALYLLSGIAGSASRPLPWVHREELALRDAYRKKDDPAAVMALTEPLLGSHRRVEALRLRCQALLQLNRYEEAGRAADEVIARDPTDPVAYVVRGGARLLLGDGEGSEGDFERALELDQSEWTRSAVAYYRRARSGQ